MPRPRNKRRPSVAITASAGQWVGFMPVGRRANGTSERRKRSATMCDSCKVAAKVECECWWVCADRLVELEDQVAARTLGKAGRAETLGQFLDRWLGDKEGQLEYLAFVDYRHCVRRLQAGSLAGLEVPELTPSPINRELKRIGEAVSTNEPHKVLRVLRASLSDYEREHPTVRNMAKLAKAPQHVPKEIVPFTVEEVARIFAAIEKRGPRARARWYVAIAGGLRQGEALGLSWHRPEEPGLPPDIDLEAATLTVREKQYRRTWEHGCADPHACAEPSERRPKGLHKTKPCPADCRRHARACPPPCVPDCTAHASSCLKRRNGGLRKGQPKGKKRRTQALFAKVVEAVREWKVVQDAERELAGSKWVEHGRIFTQPLGHPIDSRRDWGELQEILVEAGVHPAGTHATRHTAATLLRLLKVDARVVMGQMGWSTITLAERYEDFVDEMSRDAADRMGGLLWPAVATQTDPVPDGPSSATTTATTDGAKILQFRPRSA